MTPGATLGGRYGLRRRLDSDSGAEQWLARDTTLARPVEICVLPSDHPQAEAVLDAARRAAGVTDQRLIRVLDAISEDGLTLVVTEWVEGSTLTELVRRSPMPADEARTLVGEAALALEQARHRGLHHRCLTTDHVVRLEDGSIKVAGVAVEAALHGLESDDGDVASQEDTLALVGLAYAALTGYWPTQRRTVRTDPGSGPIRIGALTTPPRVTDPSSAASRPPLLPPAPQVAGAAVAPAQIVSGVPADLDLLCVQAFAGPGAPDTPGHLAGQIAPWGDSVRQDRAPGAFPLALGPNARTAGGGDVRPSSATRTAPSSQSLPSAGSPAHPADPTDQRRGDRATPLARLPKMSPTVRTAPPPPTAPGPSARPRTTPRADFGDPDWGDLFDPPMERPAPLLPPTPLTRPPRGQTRTALVLVGALLLVMLLLAWYGLSGWGDNAFIKHQRPSSTPTAAGTATTTPPAPSSSASVDGSSTGDGAIRIVGIQGFDPQGDGSEKESITSRAVDGDPKTFWSSDTYKSPQWGGLKKGVGIRLDLGTPTTVHQVTLTVPDTGADVELRTVTGDDLAGSTVVAKADGISGTVTLTASGSPTTRYLVIWFTTPAPATGGYRAAVAEVSVS